MATYSSTRHGYTLRLTINETATNVETNKSTISYTLQLISGNNYHFEQFGVGAAVTIDGVTVASRSRDNDPYLTIGFNTTLTLLSGSTQIAHNADGTKTIAVSYSLNMADRYYTPGPMSGSGSFVCATIPRATTPTVSDSSPKIGDSITISVAGRASSSFSHVLTYSCGSVSGNIATLNTSTTSHSWTVPNVAAQITTAKQGPLTIACTTMSGSTVIGTKSVQITVKIPSRAEYWPTVNSFSITEQNEDVIALGLGGGEYVQNKSVVTFAGSGTAKYGATITRTQFLVDGAEVNPENYPLTISGSVTMGIKLTDSRGYVADTITYANVYPYAPPSISAMKFYRADSSGTADDSGEYLHYAFTGAISSIGGKNVNQWAIHVQRAGTTTWTPVASGQGTTLSVSSVSSSAVVDADYSYTVRLTLTDSFTTAVMTQTIGTGYTTMDFKYSGSGVAFGKASETDDMLEIASGWTLQATKFKLTTDGQLTMTRTSNSYVDATAFGRLSARRKNDILFLNGNLSVANMPVTSSFVEIGRISGWSATDTVYLSIPCQNGSGVLLLEVLPAGVIQIYNDSGTTINGFCRFQAAVPYNN